MRIRDPKTTALIFASGKMVVTGAKSEDASKLASRKYARIVQKLGFDAKFQEFKIQNIVGSCDVKFPIRLEGLAYSHGQFSSYEPEVIRSLNNSFSYRLTFSPAISWSYLSYDQAKSCASNFCFWQDCSHWRQGESFHHLFCQFLISPRCARRFTLHSIQSTLCCANSANHRARNTTCLKFSKHTWDSDEQDMEKK